MLDPVVTGVSDLPKNFETVLQSACAAVFCLPAVMPDVRIPEWEERRLPRQCNSQKKGSLLLTRVRAPATCPTQWYGVREC